MRVNREERLRTGRVGWSRSKYTSIQGIMFDSLIAAGQNSSASWLSDWIEEPTAGENAIL